MDIIQFIKDIKCDGYKIITGNEYNFMEAVNYATKELAIEKIDEAKDDNLYACLIKVEGDSVEKIAEFMEGESFEFPEERYNETEPKIIKTPKPRVIEPKRDIKDFLTE